MRYRLSCPAPETHRLRVELELDRPGGDVELHLPVWTPGSYLVREFARHLEGVSAVDEEGRPLPIERIDKHRFRLRAGGAARATVRWQVYAAELTVRTSHVDATHAHVVGAGVFLAVRGREGEPHRLALELPAGWRAATALEGGPVEFTAADYDELCDSPLELGTHRLLRFEALGRPHELAVWGRGDLDLDRLEGELVRLVEHWGAFFGGLPYRRYLFIVHLAGGARGGLEHAASTSILLPASGLAGPEGHLDALGLLAHEYLHLWNVKRLRPAALTPYDYGREQYTRLLWWFEGATSYYEQLGLVRAGLAPAERLVRLLGERLTALARTPGAAKLPVAEASLLAWVKLYRPDEDSANSGVSYYLKGELVALALDLRLRREGASLDGLLLELWRRHVPGGVPEDGIEAVLAERLGGEAAGLLARLVHGTEPIGPDLEPGLAAIGLRLGRRAARGAEDRGGTPEAAGARPAGRPAGWLGAELSAGAAGAPVVRSVREGSPAWRAGLCRDDELVAEGRQRLDRAGLQRRVEERGPGGRLQLSLFRRDELVDVEVTLDEPPLDTLWLEPAPGATPEQRAAFEAWCGASWPWPAA